MIFTAILSVVSAAAVQNIPACDPAAATALANSLFAIAVSGTGLGIGITEIINSPPYDWSPLGWANAVNGLAATADFGLSVSDSIPSNLLQGIACLAPETATAVTSTSISAGINLSRQLHKLKSLENSGSLPSSPFSIIYDNGKRIVRQLLEIAELTTAQDINLTLTYGDSLFYLKDLSDHL